MPRDQWLNVGYELQYCSILIAKKIQPSKFKDVIGFMQWFINPAASNLIDRKELQGSIKSERLL